MKSRILAGLTAAVLAAAAPAASLAGTATATLSVTASVVNGCSVGNATLAFGNITANGATTVDNQQVNLSVTCTASLPFNIELNQGTTAGATVTNRLMSDGASHTLSYKLTQDSAHTVNWGQTIGTDTVASTGTGAAQSFTVFGQVPTVANPVVNSYTDSVTITVAF